MGGGGIIPDTIVKIDFPSSVVRSLLLKDIFFKFANVEYPRLEKSNTLIDSSFKVSHKITEDFKVFLDSIDFHFKTYAEIKFDEFRDKAGLVDSTADSSATWFKKPEWTAKEKADLEKIVVQMRQLLKNQENREFRNGNDDVKRYIREALLVRKMGQDNQVIYHTRLNADKQVQCAIKLLLDKDAYEKILLPRKK